MKTVTIYVSGGVVQSVDVPEGVQVIVRDYDCGDEDRVTGHDEGKPFVEGIHRHPNERFQPGESVNVEHTANDVFSQDFIGTVVEQKGNVVIVRDQEGDCWDVDVGQVSFAEE